MPHRAAHSHSSSVGRRAVRPVFFPSHAQNAAARYQLTRTAGMSRWLPIQPGTMWSLPNMSW